LIEYLNLSQKSFLLDCVALNIGPGNWFGNYITEMIIIRLIGIWVVLLAVVALAVDGTRSIAADRIIVTSLLEQWVRINQSSYSALKNLIEMSSVPALWDPVLTTFFSAPSWICLALLGFFIYWLGRKRRPKNPYIN